MKKSSNKKLNKASVVKDDEFYTQLSDIEKELIFYKNHFEDKVVFCNCDDPLESNFWKYFSLNFEHLKLKKLISTHYETDKPSYKLEMVNVVDQTHNTSKLEIIKTDLKQNGDFRSPESIAILEESDIVVTNPPFSLFIEFISTLIHHNKKFLVIGNKTAISYQEIFRMLKNDQMWLGANVSSGSMNFLRSSGETKSVGSYWYTNLTLSKRLEDLILFKKYYGKEYSYPKYDNYDAINVDKTIEIPDDYEGSMGVPISFLQHHNPDQFELLGHMSTTKISDVNFGYPYINKKKKFARIIIKNKRLK